MKAVLLAVVLGIACSALQAQVLDGDRRKERSAAQRDERPVERQTSEGTFKLRQPVRATPVRQQR